MSTPRGAAMVLAAAVTLAACGSTARSGAGVADAATDAGSTGTTGGEAGETGVDDDPVEVAVIAPDPDFDYDAVDYDAEPVDSALSGNRRNPSFPPPLVDPALIVTGGVVPDGIPPIDAPKFAPVGDIDVVADDEAVIAVQIEGEAKAYPVQIMIWHEIVNDEIGGVPVSVTYCPLCNSALAYERALGERVLDFGTSGELFQSALVMYDRQTGSLWTHFTGQGVVGHYAGAQLTFVPAQTISFAEFRAAHPDGVVLTRDTGNERPYGANPYPGYDYEGSNPIGAFFAGDLDRRLPSKARVVGIDDTDGAVAVRLEDLAERSVVPVTDGRRTLVVLHTTGMATPLEKTTIGEGRDVGQTGVFVAEAADGTELSFTATAGGFVDDQTGSTWNVLGRAVAGELAGQQLTPVGHVDTFWFVWSAYHPDTTILEP